MDTQFEIFCRSIRIGSLKAFPSKPAKKLKLSLKGLRFHVSLEHKRELDSVKITIPISGITLIEGHVGRGCPVLWLKTDAATARKVRRQCFLQSRPYPSPNFDPDSKELADQRIAVIPTDDPIEQREVVKLRTIVKLIAAERRLEVEHIFNEMSRVQCNEQLVRCTRYISDLKKLETTIKMKQEPKTDAENKQFAIKSETVSEKARMFGSDNETIVILSSSDEDVVEKDNTQTSLSKKHKAIDSRSDSVLKPITRQSDSDALPIFDVKFPRKTTESPTADASSPDLLNFDEDGEEADAVIPESITNVKSPNSISSPSDVELQPSDLSASTTLLALKRKAETESDASSTRKRTKQDSEDDTVSTKPITSVVASLENKGKSNQIATSRMTRDSSNVSPAKKVNIKPTNTIGNTRNTTPENKVVGNLPDSKINVKSIRGTAALTSDMLTLHQDMESMLCATPLCICVVKSQYVINCSNHKITCMALDNIDGKLTGCINQVTEPHMMRPSKNLPAHGLCGEHKERMLSHECCPGCGTFCAGGTFLVCNSTKEHQHRFHRNCLILTRHSMDCPHCGCAMSDVQEVIVDPSAEFLKKYEQKQTEIVEKSPDKRKQPCYPPCVVRIPGVTRPVPETLLFKDDIQFCPEDLKVMVLTVEEDLPKKLRFQEKNLVQLVKQGEVVKTIQLLCGTAGNADARVSTNLRTVLHEAVIHGNLSMVHALVAAGANVNARDEDGKTPIFFAEEQNRIDIVKYLITCGVNLKHADTDGMTLLHYSAKEGRIETCVTLLKYSPEVISYVDEGGWTPLVWAAEHKREETALCLTYHDADMHSIDKEGNVCLQWAALAGNKEILLMCLRKNSNVDHQNVLGDTALHIAAREDNRECVVILLAWGANPLIKNCEGQTPAQCAKDPSLCQVALLMNAMTRRSITDHKGFEPLDRERLLSPDISRGKEKIAISCVNAVDEAPCPVNPPHEFLYISKNIHKYTSINAIITNTKSCKCEHDCMLCDCGRCWYGMSGRLLPSFDFDNPPDIYECNPFCKCPSTCRNRVIQKGGVRFRIQVFRTANIGWGVRALEPIPRGSFVCEFIGEVIADGDARDDDFYLFDLDNKAGGSFCIDGRSYGNVSRYINHHCEPNLVPVRFFYDHQDKNFPRIAFFATKDVVPGEQLCFDYGEGFWDEKHENFTCECGAPNCKYSEKAYRKKRRLLETDAEMEEDSGDIENKPEEED